jgi:hypothetical protein
MPHGGSGRLLREHPLLKRVYGSAITDEEDGEGWTAYGFINAGAILAIRSGAVFTPVGGTFVVTAGLMDLSAMVKANQECTEAIYH